VDVETILHRVSLFNELDPKELSTLARFTRRRTYRPGDTLVEEGKPGFGLFVIADGTVEISQSSAQGDRVIGQLGPGQWFGEIALLEEQLRTSTVKAVTTVDAVLLDKIQFWVELRNHPDMVLAVLRALVQMIRLADSRFAQIA
jgi:CRP-like cAMP-binding protein